MFTKAQCLLGIAIMSFVCASVAPAQEPKKATGTIIGELKSRKNSSDGRNTVIDVLAPGEEKARAYHVLSDAKTKGPLPAVLAAVRAAGIGDVVEFEWVQTGHGPAIRSFQVSRKKAAGEKKR